MGTLGRVIGVALGVLVVQALAGAAFIAQAPPGGGALPVLVSNLLAAWVYVRLAERSPAGGPRLALFLFVVAAGLGLLNLVEATVFDIGIPRSDFPGLYAFSLAQAAGVAAIVTLLVRRSAGAALPADPRLSLPSLGVCIALYVFAYFAAGLGVWPFVRAFYEPRGVPPAAMVALLQVFRGAALSLIVWGILRHEPRARGAGAVSAALTLSVVGGIAPLIVPNPYFPDAVRYAHLVEVGVSNLCYAVAAAFVLWTGSPVRTRS